MRMNNLCKNRVRASLREGKGVSFLCLSAGHAASPYATTSTMELGGGLVGLEPTVEMLLGHGGSGGLVSSVTEEIFRVLKPVSSSHSPDSQLRGSVGAAGSRGIHGGSFQSAVHPHAQHEEHVAQVLVSVVVLDKSRAIDLLGASLSQHGNGHGNGQFGSGGAVCGIGQGGDGFMGVLGATWLKIHSAGDFERVVGVLLGRRAALKDVVSTSDPRSRSSPHKRPRYYNDSNDPAANIPDLAWVNPQLGDEVTLLVSLRMLGLASAHSSQLNAQVSYYSLQLNWHWCARQQHHGRLCVRVVYSFFTTGCVES